MITIPALEVVLQAKATVMAEVLRQAMKMVREDLMVVVETADIRLLVVITVTLEPEAAVAIAEVAVAVVAPVPPEVVPEAREVVINN